MQYHIYSHFQMEKSLKSWLSEILKTILSHDIASCHCYSVISKLHFQKCPTPFVEIFVNTITLHIQYIIHGMIILQFSSNNENCATRFPIHRITECSAYALYCYFNVILIHACIVFSQQHYLLWFALKEFHSLQPFMYVVWILS